MVGQCSEFTVVVCAEGYQEVVLSVKGEPNTLLKVQPTRTNILGSANNLPGGMFAH